MDDYTRTGLNAATDTEPLKFLLASHRGVAKALHESYHMAVKDVSDAFPLVPLHPFLWRVMLFTLQEHITTRSVHTPGKPAIPKPAKCDSKGTTYS